MKDKLEVEVIDQYVNDFNNEFGNLIKENTGDRKLLVKLFHEFWSQQFKTSILYNKIINKIVDVESDFTKSLTETQKDLFIKWRIYNNQLNELYAEQSFIYGYCMSNQLNIEQKSFKIPKKDIDTIKNKYPKGTKIELIKMQDIKPVPPHTKGTVEYVDDTGTIHMNWDNGSNLGIVYDKDIFVIDNQKGAKNE